MFRCNPEMLRLYRVRITRQQEDLLLFLLHHRDSVYRNWPAEIQNRRVAARLVRRGYLRIKGRRRSYVLTREGYSVAHGLASLGKFKRGKVV